MTVQSASQASRMLGGSAFGVKTPSYATGAAGVGGVINNNSVMAPATINVYGSDSRAIADNVSRNQERLVLRNIKAAIV